VSVSVCIATCERPFLLRTTLSSLASQERLPDEIVVSDGSASNETKELVEDFTARHAALRVRYLRSERRVLPWQRWNAFAHSGGDVVLFLDDDVMLAPEGIDCLLKAYSGGTRGQAAGVAGVGFTLTYVGQGVAGRNVGSLNERWLGTSRYPPGVVTPGGIRVPTNDAEISEPFPVSWLSGGAASYRRWVLLEIGPLAGLFELYEAGIGRSEDIVLSVLASRYGTLLRLPGNLAFHLPATPSMPRPYAVTGWKRGLRETLGKAHIIRWVAPDKRAARAAWIRIATWELAQAVLGAGRRPLRPARWARLAGAIYGFILGLTLWNRIPSSPRDPLNLLRGRGLLF
jgi:glycosyltransferase involved in cell wall biosynthesis